MKKGIKNLFFFIAVVITAMMCTVFSSANVIQTSGDYEYYPNGDGTVSIERYIGYEEFVTVPSKIDGKKVTIISESAFNKSNSIKQVTISEGVETIEGYAFYGCSYLENIIIPDSVNYIAGSAFCDCTSLRRINIPEDLERINGATFEGCRNLESVYIPSSVKYIGNYAFSECSSLKNVYYSGTKSQWNAIQISNNNDFENATISYNHKHSFETVSLKKATLAQNGTSTTSCRECGYTKITTIYYPKTIELAGTTYNYNGNVKTPAVTVKNSQGASLLSGSSYTVSYESGRNLPGRYTVTVTFKGNYSGTKKLSFTVKPSKTDKITSSQTNTTVTLNWNKVNYADGYKVFKYNPSTGKFADVADVAGASATVKDLKPETSYKFKIMAYTEDEGRIYGDYSAEYETKTKAGHVYKDVITKATLTKNGKKVTKCSVCGHISKTTTIYYPKTIKLAGETYNYNDNVKTPAVTVKNSKGAELSKSSYTVSYESGRNLPGRYTVTITFKGNYTGTKKLYFTVKPAKATGISLVKSTCSSINLKWNKVIDADGYKIFKYDSAKKKYVSVKDVTGTSVKVTGLKPEKSYMFKIMAYTEDEGRIYGDYSTDFKAKTKNTHVKKEVITKATPSKNGKKEIKCADCGKVFKTTVIYYPKTIKLAGTTYNYNGNVKTPTVTVKNSQGAALSKSSYTVKYEQGRNLPGRYTVTVTFQGNYSGTKKLEFTVKPAKPGGLSASKTHNTVTLKWNKVNYANGYRIFKYDTGKKKFVSIKDSSGTSCQITGLNSNTSYRFKIMAYKEDGGRIYSDYSNEIKVVTKPNITGAKTIYVGESKTYKVGGSGKVTWSTDDTSIAKVTADGKVTALKAGTVTLKATVNGQSTTFDITVKSPFIKLDKSSVNLYVGQTVTLKATVNPSGMSVSWSSSNTSVAKVSSSGKITAVSNGSATITAKVSYAGKTYQKSCSVVVVKPVKQGYDILKEYIKRHGLKTDEGDKQILKLYSTNDFYFANRIVYDEYNDSLMFLDIATSKSSTDGIEVTTGFTLERGESSAISVGMMKYYQNGRMVGSGVASAKIYLDSYRRGDSIGFRWSSSSGAVSSVSASYFEDALGSAFLVWEDMMLDACDVSMRDLGFKSY